MLTKEDIVSALPKKAAGIVNSGVVDYINAALQDQDSIERFRENLLNYNTVLTDGKYKMTDYLNAVMFVSFKMMDYSNIDAYARTFPERMKRFSREGKSMDEVHNFVSAYTRTQLVVKITTKTIIPSHILNQDLYQEALNKNAHLMRTAKREDVQLEAAKFLATHLAPPVDTKIKLDISSEGGNLMDELREETARLVRAQRESIELGVRTATQIAESKIIDVTPA